MFALYLLHGGRWSRTLCCRTLTWAGDDPVLHSFLGYLVWKMVHTAAGEEEETICVCKHNIKWLSLPLPLRLLSLRLSHAPQKLGSWNISGWKRPQWVTWSYLPAWSGLSQSTGLCLDSSGMPPVRGTPHLLWAVCSSAQSLHNKEVPPQVQVELFCISFCLCPLVLFLGTTEQSLLHPLASSFRPHRPSPALLLHCPCPSKAGGSLRKSVMLSPHSGCCQKPTEWACVWWSKKRRQVHWNPQPQLI